MASTLQELQNRVSVSILSWTFTLFDLSPPVCFNEMCFALQYCDKIIGAYFEDCGKVSPLSSEYRQVCVDEYCQSGGGKDSTCDTFSELARLCAYDGPGVFEHWRDDSAVVCGR